MPRLHLAYRNFNTNALKATELLFSRRPWGDHEISDHYEIFNDWLQAATDAYSLPVAPTLQVEEGINDLILGWDEEGEIAEVVIVANRFSVLTTFFMFRSYMQQQGLAEPDSEDALKWALSLYYTVSPKQFRRSVRRGLVAHVSPQDLLHPDAPLAFCANCEENIWQNDGENWRHVNTGHLRCPGQEIGSEVVATPLDMYAPDDLSALEEGEEASEGPLLQTVREAERDVLAVGFEAAREAREHVCDPCDRVFSSAHHLRQHERGSEHAAREAEFRAEEGL